MERLFIGFLLPQGDQEAIRALVAPLHRQFASWRWLESASYHVTLHFLGNQEEVDGTRAWEEIADRIAGRDAFTVHLGAPEFFPAPSRPASLTLPIHDDAALQSLHAEVGSVLDAQGIAQPDKMRPYRPHLTVAKPPKGRGIEMQLPALPTFGPLSLEKLSLIESRPHKGRTRYIVRQSFSFQNP